MAEYEFTSGEPIDPVYTAFKSGLFTAVAEPGKPWRWSARDKKWSTYDPAGWLLEDLQLSDTPPGDAVQYEAGIPPTYEVQSLEVAGLFARVQEAGAAIEKQYPKLNAVWTPFHGGYWRGVHERNASTPNGDADSTDLPEEALKRIARVRAFQAKDIISEGEARKLISAIVAEYS